MASITLYRGTYGENVQQFQTCFYDLENAAIDTDYTIKTASATYPPTGKTVDAVRLTITQAGMLHFAGVQNDPNSSQNLCAPMRYVFDNDETVLRPDVNASPVTVGDKPSDWDTSFFWRYYTRHSMTRDGKTIYYYQGIYQYSSTWDSQTQYYKCDEITQPFYTLAHGFFACANAPDYIYSITSEICHTATVGSDVNLDGQFSAPGFFGTKLFNRTVIGSASAGTDISTSGETVSNNLMQLCEFEYDEKRYIGIALIVRNAENFMVSATILACTMEFWQGLPGPPYYGPTSSVNIGRGTYSDVSQAVSITEIPDALKISDFGAGMHIRAIDDGNVTALFSDLWGTTDFFSKWKNLRYDPMSAIMSLHKIPLFFSSSASLGLSIANTKFADIYTRPVGARIQDLYLGEIAIPEYYGNRLDYAPHTTATVYLPFCGDYPLDITDVMGGAVSLTYRIDVATGDCIAFLVGTDRRGLSTVSKSYKGNCAFRIPVSGSDGGGAGMLSALTSMVGGAVNMAGGNIVTGVNGLASGLIDLGTARVNSSVTTIQGNAGAMSVLTPYVKIYRDVQARPDNYEILIADAAEAGGTVAQTADGYTVTGYTQFAAVELIIDATDDEKTEIERLLKTGVYV